MDIIICDLNTCYLFFSLGMKVPAIVAETEQAIEEGFSVVIGLQTTGEVGT